MVEYSKGASDDRSTAPFNMALFTLEKIHNILKNIVVVSAGYTLEGDGEGSLTPGKAQHIKYRLVRQLFIQAIPLLRKEELKKWREEMKTKLFKVTPRVGRKLGEGKVIGVYEVFDPALDDVLDYLTIDIQEKLQEEGYFMPPKHDPRYSWSVE